MLNKASQLCGPGRGVSITLTQLADDKWQLVVMPVGIDGKASKGLTPLVLIAPLAVLDAGWVEAVGGYVVQAESVNTQAARAVATAVGASKPVLPGPGKVAAAKPTSSATSGAASGAANGTVTKGAGKGNSGQFDLLNLMDDTPPDGQEQAGANPEDGMELEKDETT